MDTPPNFFGDATVGLDASAMAGDSPFVMDPAPDVDPLPQYASSLVAMSHLGPSNSPPAGTWEEHFSVVPAKAELGSYGMGDAKTPSRRSTRPSTTKASVSASSPTTGSKTSRANSDSSARTRKSLSSQSTAPPDEPEQPKRKKGKKSARAATPEPVEEDKRNKFLERNRVAASKCRQRKKEWVSELQETKNKLEAQHHQLQLEHAALVSEVGSMKNLLMAHAHCEDTNINLWIDNEARRFVQSEAGRDSIAQLMRGHMGSDVPRSAMRHSFDESTSEASPIALDPNMTKITLKTEGGGEINYDHMPDSIFEQDSRELAG